MEWGRGSLRRAPRPALYTFLQHDCGRHWDSTGEPEFVVEGRAPLFRVNLKEVSMAVRAKRAAGENPGAEPESDADDEDDGALEAA